MYTYPGTGGYYDIDPTLNSVGTTRFHVYPASHPDGGGENTEPQIQAEVTSDEDGGSNTVEWYFGSHKVATRSHSLSAYETKTFARRVAWSDLNAQGLVPGDYPLKAKLVETGATVEYGTMHLHEPIDTGGTDDGGSIDDGSTDDGSTNDGSTDGGTTDGGSTTPGDTGGGLLPSGFPTLPAMGPLTSEQTTLAAVLGVPLLVVLLK